VSKKELTRESFGHAALRTGFMLIEDEVIPYTPDHPHDDHHNNTMLSEM